MWFFNSFIKSIYDFGWLAQMRAQAGKAAAYFFLLVFFLTGLLTVPLYVNAYRSGFINQAKEIVSEKIPNFTATWNSGQLNVTDLPQPYIMREKDFVIMVDTVSSSSPKVMDIIGEANMAILVTKEYFQVMDKKSGEIQIQSWEAGAKDIKDYKVTKGELVEKVNKFLSPGFLYLAALIFFILAYIVKGIAGILFVLLASIIMLVVVSVSKKSWKFKEIFSVAMFALTLPAVLGIVLQGVLPQWSTLIEFIVLLMWIGMAVFKNTDQKNEIEPV